MTAKILPMPFLAPERSLREDELISIANEVEDELGASDEIDSEFAAFCRAVERRMKNAAQHYERLARIRPRVSSSPPVSHANTLLVRGRDLAAVDIEDVVEVDRCRTRMLLALEEACSEVTGPKRHILSLLHDALLWTTPPSDFAKFQTLVEHVLVDELEFVVIRRALLQAGFRVSAPPA